jgi:CheY-like chemotaxis protein
MSERALILLVEDNADDAALLRRAFIKARVMNPLHLARTGEEAIAYLGGSGRYANRSEFALPSLVLLDLKMPGMDGFDVLRWIRQDPTLKALRVVVLSSSDDMRDVNTAYKLGANSFLIKPADFDRFVEISQALNGYWIWMDKAPDIEKSPAGDFSREGLRPTDRNRLLD